MAPDETGHIGYEDRYHTTEFDILTHKINDDVWEYYGDGWAAQWYKKHGYTWVTDGNSP